MIVFAVALPGGCLFAARGTAEADAPMKEDDPITHKIE